MNTQTVEINIMKQAHEIARTLGKEFGHYSVRLKIALKQVWDMIRFASHSDKKLKANTGAVKMAFSIDNQDNMKEFNSQLEIIKLTNRNFYFVDGSYIKINDYVINHKQFGVIGINSDRPLIFKDNTQTNEWLNNNKNHDMNQIKFWKL